MGRGSAIGRDRLLYMTMGEAGQRPVCGTRFH